MKRLLAVLCLALLALTGCSSTTAPKPADTGAQAAQLAKSVHAGAVLAVRALDDVAARWMDSRKTPTASELEVARSVTEILGKARDVLNGAAAIDEQIPEVARCLALASKLLANVGQAPPKEAVPILEFIDGYARTRGAS